MLQRHAIQKLHDQEGVTVLLPDLMDRADIGMVESGGCPRLPLEAGQSLGVFGQVIGQELQGNKTMERGVLGLVDHTHSAAAQLFHDAVMGHGPADQQIAAVFRIFAPLAGEVPRGHFHRRALQEGFCLLLRGQQRSDFPLQGFVGRARLVQKGLALLGRPPQHRLQQAIDLFPSIGVHRSLPAWRIPPWLALGSGCQGRPLSTGSGNPGYGSSYFLYSFMSFWKLESDRNVAKCGLASIAAKSRNPALKAFFMVARALSRSPCAEYAEASQKRSIAALHWSFSMRPTAPSESPRARYNCASPRRGIDDLGDSSLAFSKAMPASS